MVIAAHAGVDPLVALSGFGAGCVVRSHPVVVRVKFSMHQADILLTPWKLMDRSLFVAIALRKTIEDAIAVVSLLMSAPFKVIAYYPSRNTLRRWQCTE